jgi:uncharacterized membrane protein
MHITHTSLIVALHIIAVVAWLGTVLTVATLGGRVRVKGTPEQSVALFGQLGWMSRAVALPGAIVTLLAGGYLLHDGGYSLSGDWWIGTGLGAWIICFLGSTMSRGSEAKRITKLAAEKGPDEEDVQWRIQRIVFLARGEALLLVVALIVMVVQPS